MTHKNSNDDRPTGDEEQENHSDERYEVVISPDGGYDKDHAELLKDRLLSDGFHDHVVDLREEG